MGSVVTEYFVIRSNKLDDLIKYVNKSITEGWQPFGGICADGNRRTVSLYYQVVVKYHTPKMDEKLHDNNLHAWLQGHPPSSLLGATSAR